MYVLFVDTLYHLQNGCLESEKMSEYVDSEEYKLACKRMVEKNETRAVYVPKKCRKLRVVKKSWYEERHRIGMEKAKRIMSILANHYGTPVIQDKLERIEGNDIVDLIRKELQVDNTGKVDSIRNKAIAEERGLTGDEIEEITQLAHFPVKNIKEVHVTGRIADKLAASDRTFGKHWYRNEDTIDKIYGVPIIYNNDSFKDIKNNPRQYRRNPTGREQWLEEIKFIEE